jgi:choline dehydrogenase-like flavoprotein
MRRRPGGANSEGVTEHYDVIIVGTGAGGGTLAHTLAPSGKRILLLERGNFLPRETDNWDPKPVFVEGKYISPDTWYDAGGQPFQPQVHYFVGGATKLYGAALYRLRPADFGELRHTDGLSPAWPLSYDDFEPWYSKAERLYQVHGNGGEDPTEGHRSEPYPWPAVSHEDRIQQIHDGLAQGGYHPFHAPCGILLDEADRHRSTCIRCTWCDGYPCMVHAKADADVIAVRPLLDRPNVTLLTGAEVTRLETDDAGRTVTGVLVARGGNREVYTGDLVAISAGAANSAKILLNSASDAHPRGLANGSDQVGRNYMFHNCKAVVALCKEKNDTVFQKTLGINDFYLPTKDYEYPMGNVQMIGKSNAEAMRGEKPNLTKLSPEWTLADVAQHVVDFWLTTEDLPPAGQPRDRGQGGPRPPGVRSVQRRRGLPPVRRAQEDPQPHRDGRPPRPGQELLHEHEHPGGRLRAPGRHLPVRHRPGRLGARRQLQGPRTGQPVRGRHQLLPQHRRGEPRADRHGQCDPRRRAPAQPDVLS